MKHRQARSRTSPPVLTFDAAYPPPVIGGKEKQAHLLTRELAREGIPVQALSFALNERGTGVWEGVPVQRLPRSVWSYLRLPLMLASMRRRFPILHIHTPSRIGLLMLLSGRLLGYRVVFKIPNEGLLDRRHGMLRRFWLWSARRAHRLVVLEEDTFHRFRAEGFPDKQLFQAVNGVELQEPVDYRGLIAEGPLRLVFAGRLVAQKRCADVLTAVAGARQAGADIHLDILGDGSEVGALRQQCLHLGLEPHVTFHGQVPDVLEHLRQAHALVLASAYEGMPNAVLEAMSMGLPVIASRVGAVPAMLADKGFEWTFEAGDIEALARRILRASEERSTLAEYGRALHSICRKKYSLESVAASYREMYLELVNGNVGSAV